MLRILPQTFYEDPTMDKLFAAGLSCIVYKTLQAPVIGREGYVAVHAITLVLAGKLQIENDEGLRQVVHPGQLVLIQKGLYTVSDILTQDGKFAAVMFFLEPELIQTFLDTLPHHEASVSPSAPLTVWPADAGVQLFTATLLQLYSGQPQPNHHLARFKLLELLHLLHRAAPNPAAFARRLEGLANRARKSLREFMLANFHQPLAIEDYAYLTGRSLSTFTRDFKSRFGGQSPKQWLIEQRLLKAHALIAQDQTQSVAQAAEESGYTNLPHFIKKFHDRFGITPKQLMIEQRLKKPV